MSEIDIAPAAIPAYRFFSLDDAGCLHPVAINGDSVYMPHTLHVATCNRDVARCREHLQSMRCTCGFYALRELPYRAKWLDRESSGEFAAQVLLSGAVIVHDRGYRAEKMTIINLIVFNPSVADVLRAAGWEVHVLEEEN